MDLVDLHPAEDFSGRFFIWHEWLQANGPLTTENAFEYFVHSMFYDKQSSNQVLRMQTMHTGQPLVNEAEELRRFTGIEFALVHSQPPSFFIIHKRERLSPDEVRPLAAYFIMGNRIYQSPDVYTLISNRLLTSLQSLQTSLDLLSQYRPAYTPRTGFAWPIKEAPAETKKRGADSEPQDAQPAEGSLADTSASRPQPSSTSTKRRQNNALLMNAMRTTAVHARQSFVLPTAPSESTIPGTPATATAGRSSTTPAPSVSQRGTTPKSASAQAGTSESAATKGQPPKKKRKRMSVAS